MAQVEESKKLATAKQFISLRLNKQNDEVLKLVSDDIHFDSQRHGKYDGKQGFKEYLDKVNFQGTWQDPVMQHDGSVLVMGSIKMLFIPIAIKYVLDFNSDGLINKVYNCKA